VKLSDKKGETKIVTRNPEPIQSGTGYRLVHHDCRIKTVKRYFLIEVNIQ